jgi:hypothetical protein
LKCEFAAVGLRMVRLAPVAGGESYLAAFRIAGERPSPEKIKPCEG